MEVECSWTLLGSGQLLQPFPSFEPCKKECWRGSVVVVPHPLHAGCVGVRGPPVMASQPWEPSHILPRRSEVE